MKTDFLVIGSGAAGLSFALKAAAHGHVTIVTKGEMNECNTNYAQGGICSVTYAPDTFEKHIRDTLVCGAGKCDEEAVGLVVRRAPELIRDLIEWGTRFDKTPDGRFELNREGGHTEHRILHHEDLTGAEIERALIESVRRHPGITVLEHRFAIDLLTQHHLGEFVTRHTRGLTCFGAYVLNLETNEIETMLAKFTVVATGGCGNIYSTTSNPVVATGDGIAMCHRAKAITENMEFIQFHPTTLYNPGEKPNFLITEAMRGFGAILRLPGGEEFMDKYHPMKSLAPRDVVARAIYREMTKRGSSTSTSRTKIPTPCAATSPTSTKSAFRSASTSPRTGFPSLPRRTTAAAASRWTPTAKPPSNGSTRWAKPPARDCTAQTGWHPIR